jgi:amino acid transporter
MKSSPAKLRTLPLALAMFCLVSGGPYGLEPVIGSLGPTLGLILILLIPVIWALPVALLTAELGTAIPEEGGYYVWVQRALGPFAGFQCAWLSFLYSIVDAALYPLLFAGYLSQSLITIFKLQGMDAAWLTSMIAVLHIVVITAINVRGVRAVGMAATLFTFLIILPFGLMCVRSGIHPLALQPIKADSGTLSVGLATVMWNYLGWDNLSTVSGEVKNPQKSIPKALWFAIPLVTLVYFVPTVLALPTSPNAEQWTDGSWPEIATRAAGSWVGTLVLLGGLSSASAMFVSQMLASSRIPAVLAKDGYLPAWLAHVSERTGTPVRSIVLCAGLYTCLAWFSFKELITVNAILYGLSVLLEFVALYVLRRKEPGLARPFRIPGGAWVCALLAIGPAVLIGTLVWQDFEEQGWLKQRPTAIAILAGVVVYQFRRKSALS